MPSITFYYTFIKCVGPRMTHEYQNFDNYRLQNYAQDGEYSQITLGTILENI